MHESKSVRVHAFGGPEVLRVEPVPIPQAKDDEVLVRVAAASLNPVDYKTREGEFPPVGEDALPAILGRDLAGTIEAVGTRGHYMLRKGDPVFAFIGFDRGGQSEYVVVKALELAAAPASTDLLHAAAVPLAGMTAWQGLFDHGGLQAGQRVLIHGGAGGVGHLAVQFAKAKGATVFATAGTDDLDYVRSIGADTAIDYKNQRFEDVATDIDLVLDLVGGETQARSFAVLRDGGTLVSTLDVAEPGTGRDRNIRVPKRWLAQANTKQLGEIAALIDAGKVKVEVAEVFPVEDTHSAYERLENGHVRGKIVLTF
ncbi:NADP-dependent oxidoreductase [Sphingomonas desiccabilis]|uniref:NADP-dependent oxidoreductase n=1 Tax=Sphingomonas desiccabilis TaxID=429134 RepID=A0A4Q2IQ07_9SPHN|nr:NADP-dependent oxidoreductase [Sphingomonas desiccabilis]MBB3912554.1 NADPH:quinone reductase-like Zn-dependent oxidoreductase [Sphingomonas desiccabilis]RXZ29854.1 NADP-dependent oxidoreductase [Sphingomonas desiccabilis]